MDSGSIRVNVTITVEEVVSVSVTVATDVRQFYISQLFQIDIEGNNLLLN